MRAASNYPFFLRLFITYESELVRVLRQPGSSAGLSSRCRTHGQVALRAGPGFQACRGYCVKRAGSDVLPLKDGAMSVIAICANCDCDFADTTATSDILRGA